MIKCTEIKELLWQYHAGETDPLQTHAVQSHLKECSNCLNELNEIKGVLQHLPGVPKHSDAYWEAYTQTIVDRLNKESAASPLILWRWAAVTALLTVLVGGTVFHRIQEKKKVQEIVANMELLDNLEVLERGDLFHEKI
jgi:predicted anti-sigma-YlaC factor YlaD